MSERALTPAAGAGLDQAMRAFEGISERLVESYQALSERAERVEAELGRTNAELERKVGELDEVNGQLEAVLQSLPTGVVVRDARGGVVRVNAAALDLAGTVDELDDLTAPADGREAVHETVGADGRRVVLAVRRSAVEGADRLQAASVEILDDRTELVTLTERMHRMDKMAALGTMGGGIAHELRNPLNAVKGFAALLERELGGAPGDSADRSRRWASKIVAGAAEADAIIESLLAFASPERVEQETIEPGALLRDALAAALPEDSPIEVSVHCDAAPFPGDRIKLRQALRNLIANAAQVQPEGGAIRLAAQAVPEGVRLAVADDGPGIAPELRSRVLDPFFTTRPEGTGLGLALVATIARLHAGRVDVDAAAPPLGGAEVTLTLPVSDGASTAQPQRES